MKAFSDMVGMLGESVLGPERDELSDLAPSLETALLADEVSPEASETANTFAICTHQMSICKCMEFIDTRPSI